MRSWYKMRKQKKKEKEEQERAFESQQIKIITFLLTLVAMALGMSFLPLFPQPLPVLLAFLVAFLTYIKPRFGMPIGGTVIGIGLLYHLSKLYFISFLGDTPVRVAVVVTIMGLFVGLPLIFNRYKGALAIDLGILAVTALFFTPTYFLAFPLIFASAVFFRKYVGLTIVYYVLISVPLLIVQYFNYITTIVRSDWWVEPGSSPPIYVSLNAIFQELNIAMDQFRLYDTSKVVYDIAGQTTWIPDWTGRTINDALRQYLDSVPGILMFVVIVVGLALALIFFTRILVSEGLIGYGDKLFPCFIATIAAVLFFIFLSALQVPLAFRADVNGATMVLGILATFLLTLPVAFVDYTPKKRATIQEIMAKADQLMDRLRVFEEHLKTVKENIPVDVSSPEGKMLVLIDSLQDTLNKFSLRYYEESELDQKFNELDKLGVEIDSLESELNVILNEFQIFANCEYSDWAGKLRASGFETKTDHKAAYQQEMSLEERIESIKHILQQGRSLAKEVIEVAEPVYDIIRPLYDPFLPEKSRAIEFAVQKLQEKEAPWIAIEALYKALNNWKKHYGVEIISSMNYLHDSLEPIANLSNLSEALPTVFGEPHSKIIDYARKAEEIKSVIDVKVERNDLNFSDIITLKENMMTLLNISRDILSMLYRELVDQEQVIERLLPTKDYLWEKNSTLRERLNQSNIILSNSTKCKINQIMENLPKYLSYIDESVQTLAVYSERKELLLNYPLAEAAIEKLLTLKDRLLPDDLPFQPRFSGEYLRIYYIQRFSEFTFDKENLVLTRIHKGN
jgi:hypothetical protein